MGLDPVADPIVVSIEQCSFHIEWLVSRALIFGRGRTLSTTGSWTARIVDLAGRVGGF